MTWKQLKERIEAMPDEVQKREVLYITDISIIKHVRIVTSDEKIYINPRWRFAYLESYLDDDDLSDPLTKVILKEGDCYLIND